MNLVVLTNETVKELIVLTKDLIKAIFLKLVKANLIVITLEIHFC